MGRTGARHNALGERSGAERRRRRLAAEEEREVAARGSRQGFQRLWVPHGDVGLLQIPREGDIGNGRRLASGGEELGLAKDGVEEDVVDTQQGGSDALVLIFGAETWVVTPRMGTSLGGFRPRWKDG